MAKECKHCSKIITDDSGGKVTRCDCCKVRFHLTEECTGLTSTEIRAIALQKRTIIFFCDDCVDAFKQVPRLLKRIDSLETDIEMLKKDIKVLKEKETETQNSSGNQAGAMDCESFIHEMNERKIRASNIMIYNIEELSTSRSVNDRVEHDRRAVEEMLCNVPNNNGVIKKVWRVGRAVSKPRPLKVVMDSSDAVLNILRNKNHIRQGSLSSDLTDTQRKHLNGLREQLRSRIDSGESDLIIKYVHGLPRIVKKNAKNM